jgi:hypothetical protein
MYSLITLVLFADRMGLRYVKGPSNGEWGLTIWSHCLIFIGCTDNKYVTISGDVLRRD